MGVPLQAPMNDGVLRVLGLVAACLAYLAAAPILNQGAAVLV